MKIRTFRHKYRFCTNLREEDLVFLRQSAGLPDDETVCLLIDDSLLMKGTKNVVFTDRRILWQEKRGAPYRQVLLSDLKSSSVFAGQNGSNLVITILNGSMSVSLTFKNIRKYDSLRIIFHDYLSRCCAGYNPLDEENARCYEKEIWKSASFENQNSVSNRRLRRKNHVNGMRTRQQNGGEGASRRDCWRSSTVVLPTDLCYT